MDDGCAGYMGAVRWVSFDHYGKSESGEVRTMDDGSVWARIVVRVFAARALAAFGPSPVVAAITAHAFGPVRMFGQPVTDPTPWDPVQAAVGDVEVAGEVRFHDVTMSVSAGEAPVLPDDVRARFARTDFILDMYESGVYDREEAGEKLFDHLFGKGRTVMDSGD